MAEKKKQKGKKEKPLEKWTVKELREEALQIEGIQGVHGMNKDELIEIVREAKGLPAPEVKKAKNIREIKTKLTGLRKTRDQERAEGASRNRLNILRKKLSRLKKQTRS
jgi:hypothetical protein